MNITEKFNNALKLEYEGKYKQALQLYYDILKQNSDYRPALLNAGTIYYKLADYDRALQYYKKALKIKNDYIVLFNIGSVYFKMGDYKRAIISLDKAYRLNKSENISLILKGIAYSKIDENENALKCFKEVLAKDPLNKISLWSIIVLLSDMKKYNDAYYYLNIFEKNYGKINIEFSTDIIINCLSSGDGKMDIILQRDGFKRFDEYISSINLKTIADDKINKKIVELEKEIENTGDKHKIISLSLYYLFNGQSQKAIEYLLMAKNNN